MKTFKNKLQELLDQKQNVSGLRGKIRQSVEEIAQYGYAHTGESARGMKHIWTKEVANVLRGCGIPTKVGNDAPRGGASGEFVVADTATMGKGQTFNELRRMGSEYITPAERMQRKNAETQRFIDNPDFPVTVNGSDVTVRLSGSVADYVARNNSEVFESAFLPKIIAIFQEHGIEVTASELMHNYNAWSMDFKSQVVTASGYSLFSACGCNDLYFFASPVKDGDETYVA